MYRPRIIPVLLLRGSTLVKSVKFRNHAYIGDPLNAARLFNEFKADELMFLDIDAGREQRTIPVEMVRSIGEEVDMPFAVGGGIRTVSDIASLIRVGAEKVVIGTEAARRPAFIREASGCFGASTISVCMDVRRSRWSGQRVYVQNGSRKTEHRPVDFARLMEDMGAGELIVQSIALDGTMSGYDLGLLASVSEAVTIPVVALGGAGKPAHLQQARLHTCLNGLAAGSMFVYMDHNRGVLINYPVGPP